MFTFLKSKQKNKRSEKALEIKAALAERWDLTATFSLPGEGPANDLADALSKVFHRLNVFITDLTKKKCRTRHRGTAHPGDFAKSSALSGIACPEGRTD